MFFFFQELNVKRLQKRFHLLPGMVADVRVTRPRIAISKELTAKPPARSQRERDVFPETGKMF